MAAIDIQGRSMADRLAQQKWGELNTSWAGEMAYKKKAEQVQAEAEAEAEAEAQAQGQGQPNYDAQIMKLLGDYKQRAADQAGQTQKQLEFLANQPMQTDLSPLLALSDQWFGGKSARNYQRPPTPMERMQQYSGLQQALQKQQTGLMNQELNILQKMAERQLREKQIGTSLDQSLIKSQDKRNRADTLQTRRFVKEWVNDKENGRYLAKLAQNVPILDEVIAELETKPGGAHDWLPSDEMKARLAQLIVWYNSGEANLGALSEGDRQILNDIFGGDPTSVLNTFKQRLLDTGGALGPLKNMKALLSKNFTNTVDNGLLYGDYAKPIVAKYVQNLYDNYGFDKSMISDRTKEHLGIKTKTRYRKVVTNGVTTYEKID